MIQRRSFQILGLALSTLCVAFALAQEAPLQKRSLPSLAAVLSETTPSGPAGFVLTDLEGWTLSPAATDVPEVLTRLTLNIDAKGSASVGPLESKVAWRGIRLPSRTRVMSPVVEGYRQARVKLLLYGPGGPVLKSGPRTRVVLKTGNDVHASFAALAKEIEGWDPETQITFDARSGVPARHALTGLAIVCRSRRSFQIAAPEASVHPLGKRVKQALTRAASAAGTKDWLSQLALRIRPDARCSWGAVQGVLEAAVREKVVRVTLTGNAGEFEVDLFQSSLRRPGVREISPEIIEKPIIILEEEVIVENEVPKVRPLPKDPSTCGGSAEDGTKGGGSVQDAYGVGGGAAGAYGGRFYKLRRAEGTSVESEAAVEAALTWLKKHQDKDGAWKAAGTDCCESKTRWGAPAGDARFDVGISSLAILAYLGNGHTHRFGHFKRSVNKGLRWLKRRQRPDGSIGVVKDHPESVYNHAYATQAICEAYAVSRDFTLKRYAVKAVEWILAAQNPGAGWKYGVRSGRSDTSITGAMTIALLLAETAGIKVPKKAMADAQGWLDTATGPKGVTGYQTRGGASAFLPATEGKFEGLPVNTAIAVFTRVYGRGDRKVALLSSRHLSRSLPVWDRLERKVNFYYWYYGAHAMFQVGGEPWKAWVGALREALLPNQEVEGCASGSWAPRGEWGIVGGRSYSTALGALSLETSYRYERR